MIKRKGQRRSRRRRDPNAKLLGPAQLLEERNEREVKISADVDGDRDVDVDGDDVAAGGRQMYRSESVDTYDASASFDSTSLGSSLESKESSLKHALIPPSSTTKSSPNSDPLHQPALPLPSSSSSSSPLPLPLVDSQRSSLVLTSTDATDIVQPLPTAFEKVQQRALTSPLLAVTEGKDQDEESNDSIYKEEEVEGEEGDNRIGPGIVSKDREKESNCVGIAKTSGKAAEEGLGLEVVMKSIGTQSQPEEAVLSEVESGEVCKLSVEAGLREKRVSPAPKEIAAQPMSKTGLMSQLRSQMQVNLKLGAKVPSMLGFGDIQIDQYIPGVVKQLANGGEDGANETTKEIILWTSFQRYDTELYLLVGYHDGFHVWNVSNASAATKVKEVLSIRSGWAARIVRFLAKPAISDDDRTQEKQSAQMLEDARPLLAVVNETDDEKDKGSGEIGTHATNLVRVYSLAWNRWAREIPFESRVHDVQSNARFVFIALRDVLFAFDASTLEHSFGVSCYPCSVQSSAFALSHRWLAYPGTLVEDAGNHATSRETQSYRRDDTTGSNRLREVSKDLVSGIYYLQGLVHRNASSANSASGEQGSGSATTPTREDNDPAPIPGFVVVQDLTSGRTLSHFRSHEAEIEVMEFNPNGSLLAVAPVGGQTVHIHRIEPNTGKSGQRRQQLLYKLERGLMHASIRSIAFSNDLRWVALASSSGTAHLFAISYGGGTVDAYTHPAILMEEASSIGQRGTPSGSGGSPSGSPGGAAVSTSPLAQSNWKDKVVQAVSRRLPVSVVTKQLHPSAGEADAKVFVSTKPLRVQAEDRCVVLYPLARVRQRVTYANQDKPLSPGLSPSANYPLDVCFEGGKLRLMSANGVLEHYDLMPFVTASEQDVLRLDVQPRNRWDVCRREDWPGICASLATEGDVDRGDHALGQGRSPTHGQAGEESLDLARGDLLRGKWLSHAEIKSHVSPIIPLWGSPQFRFMTLDEDHGDVPLFVESVAATTVKVRGAGPSPVDPGSGRLVRRLDSSSDKHLKDGVKVAIETPTRFQHLHVASEKEVAETILVYDEEEGSGVSGESGADGSGSRKSSVTAGNRTNSPYYVNANVNAHATEETTVDMEVDGYMVEDNVDDCFLQDEELYGDAVLEEMKRRKQQKLKEN